MRNVVSLATCALLALASLTAGCGKKDGGGNTESAVIWPKAPSDGTPMVAEFVALEGAGDKMEAKLRLFNFADKPVTSIRAKLHYLDAGGNELKSFPWTQTKPAGLVGAKGVEVIKGGMFLPAETKSVAVELGGVEYADGTTWSRP